MDAIVAHLNGGPMDDQEVALQAWELRVAKPPTFDWTTLNYTHPTTMVGLTQGSYRVRVDDNGQPVAHSLNAYSFDWQGWEN